MPDSSLSAWSSVSASMPERRSTATSAPGSTDPERVAIGTPSSGVNPIVVSTERPSTRAVTELPPPRWHTTWRSGAGDNADHLGRSLGRPRDREPVEAVPAHPPLLAPAARHRVGRRRGRDRGVERGVEHRHVGQGGEAPPGLVEVAQGEGVVQRGERPQVFEVGPPYRVVHHHRIAEPLAAVDDAVGDRIGGRVDLVQRVQPLRLGLLRGEQVQLQAGRAALRTRIAPTPSVRPLPVADLGRIVAVLPARPARLPPPDPAPGRSRP